MNAEDTWELVVMTPSGPVVRSLGKRATLIVGRGQGVDVRVDEPSLSRRHVALHIEGDAVSIEDLGSANGTRLVTADDDGTTMSTAETLERRLTPHQRTPLSPRGAAHLGSIVLLVRPRTNAFPHEKLDVVAEAPAMRRALELTQRIADAPLSVLLLGETGVGKDVMARVLHASSQRRDGPFVAINCAALAEHLVESELFGHEKGAFTGAQQTKVGLLEAAHGGTVFLDEVGELPLLQQSKLLRALEAREVLRVGAIKPRPVDVRFVAATHRDPEQAVANGSFRKDLYFRLSGLTIHVPPLRERREDVLPLAQRFLDSSARAMGRKPPELERDARALLEDHRFPGNVRELRNVIERAVALAEPGATIRAADLLLDRHPNEDEATKIRLPARAEEHSGEKQRIVDALARCGGNQTRAAELLGISRRTLVTRLGELGIVRPRARPPAR